MTHRPYEELESQIDDAASRLAIGSLWRHYKTLEIYRIMGFSILESDDSTVVNYTNVSYDKIPFIAPVNRFFETVESDGDTIRRFEPID